MPLIRFSIDNPLITNLMLLLVFIAGVLSWQAMPQEMFPLVELDRITITTEFKGAAPAEVERQVTLPIEEEFDGEADIDTLMSTSSEGLSSIVIELKQGSDVDAFLDEARSIVDRVTDLPEEAEEPEVRRLETRFPVISMAVYGDVAAATLYDTADEIKRRLLEIPGVASAQPAGIREWELWVAVDPHQLAARRVTLEEIAQALRQNLAELPGGSLESEQGDILLRGIGVAPEPRLVEQVPVRSNARGGVLRLGQVAEVDLRFEEARTLARYNGQPSVNITVTKTAEASTIEVSEQVRLLSEQLRQELPATLQTGVFSDLSLYVKNRLNTVKSSGVVGLVLVLLSLYLFLNFRVALITAMGIPVSFLIAIIGMNLFGHTINMVSLFAFLIALGMIVDDAIIVTENIYRHLEMGKTPHDAALIGTREVMAPVIASTATTVAAFLPVFAIGGTMGAFVAVIPVVVSCALLGSLWEAFAVLPSHANEFLRLQPRRQQTGSGRWRKVVQRYAGVLGWAVVNRYLVAVATVGVLAIVIAVALTRVPFQLFGSVETGQFFVNIETPNTYSLEDSAATAERLEQVFNQVIEDDELHSLLTNVGVTFIDFNTIRFGSKHIQFIVDLEKREPQGFIETWISPVVSLEFSWEGARERATETIINQLRQRLLTEPGIEKLSILRPQGGPTGADIEVGVHGKNIQGLMTHGDAIAAFLKQTPGVYDVRTDMEAGKLEYRYQLNERGRQLGLTQMQLADAVRRGYQGEEVVYVTRADERIPVRLIFTDAVRDQLETLQRLPIVVPGGGVVILSDVADIDMGRGIESIKHRDLRRLVTVTAEVDDDITTPLAVTDLIRQEFESIQAQRDYGLVFLGEKKEAAESVQDMLRALVIALTVIFFILAVLFRSLFDPFVVMFAIPFGLIGVVAGHIIMGEHLQFLSLLGFLALTGIVVNDSLILIEFVKRMRGEGHDRLEAVVEAGRVRMRPIILTSVTTFLGVSPLIFFATGQAAFLAPMAISLGFGLLFATLLILVVLPCFYLIGDDLHGASCRRWRQWFGASEQERV